MFKVEENTRENQTIYLNRMSHPKDVSDFLRLKHEIEKAGWEELILEVSNNTFSFPNAVVPISGLVDFTRTSGIDVKINYVEEGQRNYIKTISFHEPLKVSDNLEQLNTNTFDRIWKYNSVDEVSKIVETFRDKIFEAVECEKGVLQSFDWCLTEVLDNILNHSQASCGYVMCKLYSNKHVALCIFDTGIGIKNSFKESKYNPSNCIDAITLAIQEGVTRDKEVGQGNGLWGLCNIIHENLGSLCITSGNASYMVRKRNVHKFDKLPYLSPINQCTTIDFQIDLDKKIDISKILGGYEPIILDYESYETEAGDGYLYSVIDKKIGTGTRVAGARMRNEIVNLITTCPQKMTIDFTGINTMSSSFADEFIGKLVAKYGFLNFNNIFRLKNVDESLANIINRSVSQRIFENYSENK